jgi:AmmeMemoRadiSam system protein B
MSWIREPAVIGSFYPGTADRLRKELKRHFEAAVAVSAKPKALIAPHAGYEYSGPIAASAYATLLPHRATIERVVLLGPAHRVPFFGLAASSAEAFQTPLGPVPLDEAARALVLPMPQVRVFDRAHELEHSLEVQLPFLQTVLDRFEVVPLVVGEATPMQVGEVLDRLWGGPETLIVVSSDLSHYHDAATARGLDREAARSIEALATVPNECACGCRAVNGLLRVARRRGLRPRTIDLRNSGDTAGGQDQVVGYGAFVFEEPAPPKAGPAPRP